MHQIDNISQKVQNDQGEGMGGKYLNIRKKNIRMAISSISLHVTIKIYTSESNNDEDDY